jgi:hypothetical protein
MKDRNQTIRLTIDFPLEQHTYIKMLAAKEGISLRKFVMDRLPDPKEFLYQKNRKDQFNSLLEEIISDYEQELKNLSDR